MAAASDTTGLVSHFRLKLNAWGSRDQVTGPVKPFLEPLSHWDGINY